MKTKSTKEWIYLEIYKNCACTVAAREKRDLRGYCPRHGNEKRRIDRLPGADWKDEDLGYAGVG